jgi:hypothetical protein
VKEKSWNQLRVSYAAPSVTRFTGVNLTPNVAPTPTEGGGVVRGLAGTGGDVVLHLRDHEVPGDTEGEAVVHPVGGGGQAPCMYRSASARYRGSPRSRRHPGDEHAEAGGEAVGQRLDVGDDRDGRGAAIGVEETPSCATIMPGMMPVAL